jgi:hypothetical protein
LSALQIIGFPQNALSIFQQAQNIRLIRQHVLSPQHVFGGAFAEFLSGVGASVARHVE